MKMNRTRVFDVRRLAALTAATILATAMGTQVAIAQSTGSLVGQVTDISGAVLANAKILVTSVETNMQRRTTTTAEGYFSVPSLPPANYTVEAAFSGFKTALSAAIKVDITALVPVHPQLAALDVTA